MKVAKQIEIIGIVVENEDKNGGSFEVGKWVESIREVQLFGMNLFRVSFVHGQSWDDGLDVLVNSSKVIQIKIKSEGS
jgi:hypothetical protein